MKYDQKKFATALETAGFRADKQEETSVRAYTTDELRDMLLERIRNIAEYWAKTDLNRSELQLSTPEEVVKYRCHGVAFTILSLLDGSQDLPGFDLIPVPHSSDKAFHISQGENWVDPESRISTNLHEFYHKR